MSVCLTLTLIYSFLLLALRSSVLLVCGEICLAEAASGAGTCVRVQKRISFETQNDGVAGATGNKI